MKEAVRIQSKVMSELNELTMPGEIVVFGSTYMSAFPFYELAKKCAFENAVYNRSISGLTVKDALEIVNECVINIQPSKVFLALGEEDENDPNVMDEYTALVCALKTQLPECDIYLIRLIGRGEYVESFNKNILKLCDQKKIQHIDLVTKNIPDTALYKARFKQLSHFFRNKPINTCDAFVISRI